MTQDEKIISNSIEILGSVIEIKLLKQHAKWISLCFLELERIDKTYSRFRADSVLSKINSQLNVWHNVDNELLFLVNKAKELQDKTHGEFDCTVKSDLERLGYDATYSFVEKPIKKQTAANRIKNIFLEPIEINIKQKKVLLRKEIEFGGFGKGFALDAVARILEENNVDHYYINAGGDIYAKRGKAEKPWEVLLEHPDDFSLAIGKLELDGNAIACSAPNRRKWTTQDGKTYHHLINSRTRLPQLSVKSIFVLAKTGIEADGYATALFAAGFDEAIKLSKKLPVKIILVSAENRMFVSELFPVEFYS